MTDQLFLQQIEFRLRRLRGELPPGTPQGTLPLDMYGLITRVLTPLECVPLMRVCKWWRRVVIAHIACIHEANLKKMAARAAEQPSYMDPDLFRGFNYELERLTAYHAGIFLDQFLADMEEYNFALFQPPYARCDVYHDQLVVLVTKESFPNVHLSQRLERLLPRVTSTPFQQIEQDGCRYAMYAFNIYVIGVRQKMRWFGLRYWSYLYDKMARKDACSFLERIHELLALAMQTGGGPAFMIRLYQKTANNGELAKIKEWQSRAPKQWVPVPEQPPTRMDAWCDWLAAKDTLYTHYVWSVLARWHLVNPPLPLWHRFPVS